jgi:hypothetical protein
MTVSREFELKEHIVCPKEQGFPRMVRLCTNDDAVVQSYQSLDDQLERNLEVFDCFVDEAKEVYRYNPWLNYALPLHLCRQWGFPSRLLVLLDEKPLTLEEMRDFLQLLFYGTAFQDLPDPAQDWKEFTICVSQMVDREEHPWNLIKKKPGPWIDVRQLDRCYGPRHNFQWLPSRHNFQWLPFRAMAGLLMLGAVLRGLVVVFHPMWHGLILWWNEGRLPWIVGGVLLLVFALSRCPPSARLLLALAGVIFWWNEGGLPWIVGGVLLLVFALSMCPTSARLLLVLSLALPSLWDKPWAFWQGIGWSLGGTILFLGTIAYNEIVY